MEYKAQIEKGKLLQADANKFFQKNRLKGKKLDDAFHEGHEKAFKRLDCLACANCCKTTSPIFRDVDIKRIAKHLRKSEQKLIADFLHMDEEGDYVLNTSPCTFLDQKDNTCSIYDFRPLACREYPHTDRKNMNQIAKLTVKNMEICPAVAEIVEEILANNSTKK